MVPIENKGRRKKIAEKAIALRQRLWPDINEERLWHRKRADGFATIPRTMPLIMSIADDLAGEPVGATYLELWCRAFDEAFVNLAKQAELAFHSGFSGQRAVRTWRARMEALQRLAFISLRPGPSGPLSYALIINPYLVIREHVRHKTAGMRQDKYNALIERAIEIGARDLEDPSEATASSAAAAPTSTDDIPF